MYTHKALVMSRLAFIAAVKDGFKVSDPGGSGRKFFLLDSLDATGQSNIGVTPSTAGTTRGRRQTKFAAPAEDVLSAYGIKGAEKNRLSRIADETGFLTIPGSGIKLERDENYNFPLPTRTEKVSVVASHAVRTFEKGIKALVAAVDKAATDSGSVPEVTEYLAD